MRTHCRDLKSCQYTRLRVVVRRTYSACFNCLCVCVEGHNNASGFSFSLSLYLSRVIHMFVMQSTQYWDMASRLFAIRFYGFYVVSQITIMLPRRKKQLNIESPHSAFGALNSKIGHMCLGIVDLFFVVIVVIVVVVYFDRRSIIVISIELCIQVKLYIFTEPKLYALFLIAY